MTNDFVSFGERRTDSRQRGHKNKKYHQDHNANNWASGSHGRGEKEKQERGQPNKPDQLVRPGKITSILNNKSNINKNENKNENKEEKEDDGGKGQEAENVNGAVQ